MDSSSSDDFIAPTSSIIQSSEIVGFVGSVKLLLLLFLVFFDGTGVNPSASVLHSTFSSSILTTNVSCTPCAGKTSAGCCCCSIETSGSGNFAAIEEYSGLGKASMGVSFFLIHSSSSDDSIAPTSSIIQSSEIVGFVGSVKLLLLLFLVFFDGTGVNPSASVLHSTFSSSILTTNVSCTPCAGKTSAGCCCCSIETSGSGIFAAIDEYSGLGKASTGVSFIFMDSSSSDDPIAPTSSIIQSSEIVGFVGSVQLLLLLSLVFFDETGVKPSSSVLQSTFSSSILTTKVSCTPCTGNFSVGCGCCSIVTSGTGSIAAIDEYSGLGEANMGIFFISLHSSSSDDSIAPISSIFESSELVASVVSMFFSLETTISFFSLLPTVSSSVGILSILGDFIASTSSIIQLDI